ncbi:MAG TPA: L-lactate dehydrogenase [Clostridiales bacterium]|nr:L-lactate dehydrogenase [Clostridiales bacterium]
MENRRTKVVIIGAGFVGSSVAFAIVMYRTADELVLIDADKEKAIGVELDINHGICFMGQMKVYAGDYPDIVDADVIVITAGANRKPGETRLDLARKNMAIMQDITFNIIKYYNRGVILVVSNPVDVLTYFASRWSGLPEGRILGTGTVLDSARFRYLLGQKLDVDVKNVHGYIIGEHGDSQLPAWSATHIAGIQVDNYCQNTGISFDMEERTKLANEVMTSGAMIIRYKGVTNYGIAVAVNTLVETISKNQHTIRTVSAPVNGKYGISGVSLSLPSIVGSEGIIRVIEPELTMDEIEKLRRSANQITATQDELKRLGYDTNRLMITC